MAAETTGRLNVISDVTQMARDVYERHRDVITTMATDRGSMATDDDDMARRFIAYHYASYLHQSANANFIFQRPWLAPIRRISRPIFAGRPAPLRHAADTLLRALISRVERNQIYRGGVRKLLQKLRALRGAPFMRAIFIGNAIARFALRYGARAHIAVYELAATGSNERRAAAVQI